MDADARVGIVADANNNLLLDSKELIESSQFSPLAFPEWVDEELAPGDYFVLVYQGRFDAQLPTGYTLEMIPMPTPADTPSDPGEVFATALDINPFTGNRQFRDNVGTLDMADFYKFTLTESSTIRADLLELSEDLELALVADIDNDGIHDSKETIEVSRLSGKSSETIDEQLPEGNYFFLVFQDNFQEIENSNYLLELDIQVTPSSTPADPGNNFATALDIDPLNGPTSFEDSAGSLDTRDFYKFTLTETATVSAELRNLNEDLELSLVADIDNDGTLDSNETIERMSSRTGKSGEWVEGELSPGTYFFLVFQDTFQEDVNSHYRLDVDIESVATTTATDPGNNFATALAIDPSAGPLSILENVGSLDTRDYYEFTLAETATVTANLSGLSEDLELAIIADINSNGVHDSNESIEVSRLPAKSREYVREQLGPGTYLLMVFQDTFQEGENSHYVLDVRVSEEITTPLADPGNTLATAHVIDPLPGGQSFRQNVGALDKIDYYEFTLTSYTSVRAELSGLDEDLEFGLVADINGNGLQDGRDLIDSSTRSGASREWFGEELAPGTYYLLVFQDTFQESENSHYQLNVDFAALGPVRPSDPGNTPGTAENLGTLAASRLVEDVVGSFDAEDYYQFTLATAATVQLVLDGLQEDLELALVQDPGDGVIATSSRAAKEPESLLLDLAAGTYQARIFQDSFQENSNSHYRLDIRFPTAATANLTDPGSLLATALDLGTLTGPIARTDFVGDVDGDDFYMFHLDEPRQVRVSLFGLTQDADFRIIADRNGNFAIDSGDIIETGASSGAAPAFQSEDLGPGDYFVHVMQASFPGSQNTDYTLEITSSLLTISTPGDPGNTLGTAQDLGQLPAHLEITDYVGSLDTADSFRFELTRQSDVRVRLDGLVEEAAVSIIADVNSNLVIDAGEVVENTIASGMSTILQTEALPPGIYFLQISPDTFPAGQNTRYLLDLEAVPLLATTPSDPGDSLVTALDIGPLTAGTRLARQSFRDAVGNLDPADLFRFRLEERGELQMTVDGLSEDIQLSVIADINGNFAIHPGEVIELQVSSGTAAIANSEFLAPGEYYVSVAPDTFPAGENSAFHLTLNFLGAGFSAASDPGNTLAAALPIDISSPTLLRDAVGDLDPVDLYQFTLAQAAELRLRLDDLHEDAMLSIIADTNGNGAIDSGETIETATSSGLAPILLTEVVSAGSYFLQVSRDTFPAGENTLYNLSVTTTALEVAIGSRTFTYESEFSQLTNETDELGRPTLYDVDPANGNILKITQIDGQPDDTSGESDDVVVSFTYLVETVTDPLGRVTRYQYNNFGQLEMIVFAEGTADQADQIYDYNQAGNLDESEDENGNVTSYTYDPLNRLLTVTETDPDSGGPLTALLTEFVYDVAGNLVTVVEASTSTQFFYDERDRLVEIVAPKSRTTRFGYDFVSNLTRTTDPLNGVTNHRYDERNRLVETVDPLLASTRYRYDQNDNLVRLTDPLDNITEFFYDPRNRLIQIADPRGTATRYQYDAVGNRVSTRDRNGRLMVFEYGENDELVEEIWFDVNGSETNAIGYEYDTGGNVLEANDAFDSLTFTYDDRDRPQTTRGLAIQGSPNVQLTYAYDGMGNVLTVDAQIGMPGVAAGTTTYQYNASNQATVITQSGTGTVDKRVDLTYDQLGRWDTISRFTDLLGTAGAAVIATSFSHDSEVPQRVSQVTHGDGGSPVAEFLYTYNRLDQIVSVVDVDGTTTYSYDKLGQLTGAAYTDPTRTNETFSYDAAGNRVLAGNAAAVFSTGNRLQSDGDFTYDYDNEGNVVRRTEKASGDFVELAYDNRNRLTQTIRNNVGGQETGRIDYAYDALNRRISERANDTIDEVVRYFAYDRDAVLLTFVDPDADGPSPTQFNQRFLNGPAVDQVLAEESFGEVDWYLSDVLGSVRDRLDSAASIVDHIKYDAFGRIVSETNPGDKPLIGYAGGRRDAETGLTFLRNRYYDPGAGRFLSQDPLGHAAGGSNLYLYALNDPVNNTDPTGLIVPQLASGSGRLQSLLSNRISIGGRLDVPFVDANSIDPLVLYNRNTLLSTGTNALKSPFGSRIWQAMASTGGAAGQSNRSRVPGAAWGSSDPLLVFAGTGVLARGNIRALADAMLVGATVSDELSPSALFGFVVELSPVGLFFGTIDRQVVRVH